MKQENVQKYEQNARQEMYEYDTEHEVEREVVILSNVIHHPVG